MNYIINKYFSFPDKVKVIVNVVPDNDPLLVSSISATDFADTVNPVCEETGMRRNDIDVAMSCTDPSLRNTLLAGLSKDVDPLAADNSGLSDDEIASQAIPRNTHISDIVDARDVVNDYISSLEEPELDKSVPAPAATPEPIPLPQSE
jgi:hypothetical protein